MVTLHLMAGSGRVRPFLPAELLIALAKQYT